MSNGKSSSYRSSLHKNLILKIFPKFPLNYSLRNATCNGWFPVNLPQIFRTFQTGCFFLWQENILHSGLQFFIRTTDSFIENFRKLLHFFLWQHFHMLPGNVLILNLLKYLHENCPLQTSQKVCMANYQQKFMKNWRGNISHLNNFINQYKQF